MTNLRQKDMPLRLAPPGLPATPPAPEPEAAEAGKSEEHPISEEETPSEKRQRLDKADDKADDPRALMESL